MTNTQVRLLASAIALLAGGVIANTTRLLAILAATGSLLYAISDVLLLAYEVGPREPAPDSAEAGFVPYVLRPSMAGRWAQLASLPARRLAWGGLLGVLATPLVLAGLWPLYHALRPAGPWLSLAPTLLLAYALILAPFLHGSFIYIEHNARALARLSAEGRTVLGPLFHLQQRLLFTAYAAIAVLALLACLLFAVAVASGSTLLPRWMAAANPVMTILAWLVLKRLLPHRVAKYAEGAGFNIGFLLFFSLLAIMLW